MKSIEYITEKDLELINFVLMKGDDVKIQVTKNGVRILRETVRVLDHKTVDKK